MLGLLQLVLGPYRGGGSLTVFGFNRGFACSEGVFLVQYYYSESAILVLLFSPPVWYAACFKVLLGLSSAGK